MIRKRRLASRHSGRGLWGWDAALLGLLEAVAHHGEAGGVVVEESLIKVLYRFHQNN